MLPVFRDVSSNRGVVTGRGGLVLALGAGVLVVCGVGLRVGGMVDRVFWADEAESSINALTILRTGLPLGTHLGEPVYENTLTETWPAHPEYAYRDSSYAPETNLAVYHGWLPLYAIAGAQALAGIGPDRPRSSWRPAHDTADIVRRTVAPRLPGVVFSLGAGFVVWRLLREVAGTPAAIVSLGWFCLGGKLVWFGYQARYYGATLFFSALTVHALYRVWRTGSRGAYVWFGVCGALLFHTHALSALVLAVAALTLAPWLVRREGWLPRGAACVGVAVLATVPWALATGFFETAGDVPKVHRLFDSWADWLAYVAARPRAPAVLALLLAPALLARFRPGSMPGATGDAFRRHFGLYGFLLCWAFLAYAAFHTLVPAASYFSDRLTLMLMLPYVFLLSLLIGDGARVLGPRRAALAALPLGVLSVYGVDGLATAHNPFAPMRTAPASRVMRYLETAAPPPEAELYASPGRHLVLTYYTGLPIQSIAPVRKAYLDNREGPVLYFEGRAGPFLLPRDRVAAALREAGRPADPASVDRVREAVWCRIVREENRERGLPVPDEKYGPEPPAALLAEGRRRWSEDEAYWLGQQSRAPIFRDVAVDNLDALWLAFYYRFVGYGGRIGENANYRDRLRNATVTFLPEASTVVYRSERPVN